MPEFRNSLRKCSTSTRLGLAYPRIVYGRDPGFVDADYATRYSPRLLTLVIAIFNQGRTS